MRHIIAICLCVKLSGPNSPYTPQELKLQGGGLTRFLESLKISPCEVRRLEDTQNLKCEDRRFQNCLGGKAEDLVTKPTKPED